LADAAHTAVDPHEEDRAAQAEFDAGVAMEAGIKAKPEALEPEPAAKPVPVVAENVAKPPELKYIRITEDQFASLNAAAAKTATFEQQLSKAFGTIGNMQKVVNGLQASTPRGLKVEIPKDAFAAMAKDFPELAEHTRAGLEATLRGLTGTAPATADIDPERMKHLVNEHVIQLETEALEDAFPDWRIIVGAVDISKQQPDSNNQFRKWLNTKPAAYQAKVNGTNSAAVLSRAIQAFQSETKEAPKATPGSPSLKDQLRTARIQAAVKPRGDGGQAPPSRTEDDDFAEGFNAR
jgi:hypothetical protein